MVELTHLVGVAFAVGAAFMLATQDLLVRMGSEHRRTSDAVFIVTLSNLFILLPLVAIVYYPDYGLTRVSYISFIAAGIVGTLVGRFMKYSSIKRIGASRTAPIVSTYALISTILGILILDETLTSLHLAGVVAIVIGVASIAWETSHDNPDDLSRTELLVSLLIPIGAAVAIALEPIFANFGFAEGTPAPVGLVIKTVAAGLGFTLYLWWEQLLPDLGQLRGSSMRWFLLAGIANTLFLLGYYLALEIAPVNVVVPLIITSTLFVVVLSAIFMPHRLERVSWRLIAASVVVVAGVLVITVS